MWIKHLYFRKKKTAILFGIALFIVVLLSRNAALLFFSAGALCGAVVIFVYLMFRLGVMIHRHSFVTGGASFDVLEHITFGLPVRRKLILLERETSTLQSVLFLHENTEWAYHDEVRRIAAHIPSLKRALSLGGGGGTVGNLLCRTYGARTDIVELSADMIRIAKTFFFPVKTPGVSYHHTNAAAFIAAAKKPYDLIFVDVFQGNKLDKDLSGAAFFRNLKRLLTPNGILVMNLSDDVIQLDRTLPKTASYLTYGVWHGTMMGFWSHDLPAMARILTESGVMLIPDRARPSKRL